MRRILIAATAALVVTTPGAAQLLGGRISRPTVSLPTVSTPSVSVPSVSTPSVGLPSASAAIDQASQAATQSGNIEVRAGVSTRVDRTSRCHWAADDSWYDPVERDGRYYCEPPTTGAAAGAAVTTPR